MNFRKIASSLWTQWIVLTAAYGFTILGAWQRDNWHYPVNALVGLFVPMLMGNVVYPSQSNKWLITYPLLFLGLYIGERVGRWMGKWVILRTVWKLCILAVLTTAMDLIVQSTPMSILSARDVWEHRGNLVSCCLH